MNNQFPDDMAVIIARQVKLYPKSFKANYYSRNSADFYKFWSKHDAVWWQYRKLSEFQTAALTSSFKDAMLIYHDIDLTKKQKRSLKKIYKITPVMFKSNLIMNQLYEIDRGFVSSRSVRQVAKLLKMI